MMVQLKVEDLTTEDQSTKTSLICSVTYINIYFLSCCLKKKPLLFSKAQCVLQKTPNSHCSGEVAVRKTLQTRFVVCTT